MTHSKVKDFRHDFPPDQEFYTLDRALSHEGHITMVQSIRDVGKSYDMRARCHKWIGMGYNCIWLRWERTELGTTIDSWLEQFDGEYEDITPKGANIVYKTYQLIGTDNKVVFACVKDSNKVKDIQVPNLRWLVYDECVPESYDIRTRRDIEFDKFTSIYMSFARKSKGLRAVLMCNVIDWFNPFTRGWEIFPFETGIIRTFIDTFEVDDGYGNPTKATLKIVVENIKPSPAMLKRVIELAKIRYTNKDALQKYIQNATAKEYGLIGKCPDMTVPLHDLQFRRGEHYYSFRVYEGIYYFCEIKPREDYPTEVFKFGTNGHMEGRRPQLGKMIEELINAGLVRFENGHVFNEIMNGLADYRMRAGI